MLKEQSFKNQEKARARRIQAISNVKFGIPVAPKAEEPVADPSRAVQQDPCGQQGGDTNQDLPECT